jgi:hypothetical protein
MISRNRECTDGKENLRITQITVNVVVNEILLAAI